jgi:alcohol dehydrogenase class IV
VIFGAGAARGLPVLASAFGRRVLVVSNASQPCPGPLECVELRVEGEPTVALAREGAQLARERGVDAVIGFGGGSAIDAAKAIAALAANPGDPLDYLEVIGAGSRSIGSLRSSPSLHRRNGRGSDRNAVLASPEHRFKASLRSRICSRKCAVDPELTSVAGGITRLPSGCADAVDRAIRSSRANPLNDPLCLEACAPRVRCRGLPRWREHGSAHSHVAGEPVRRHGSGQRRTGCGARFRAPIGGMFSAPHGAVCAALLPHGMEANIQALRSRAPEHEAVTSIRRWRAHSPAIARLKRTTDPHGGALVRELAIPPLGPTALPRECAEWSRRRRASSMKANPIQLTAEELTEVLLRAL